MKMFSFVAVCLLISVRQSYGFDPELARALQTTLDSLRIAINVKGISSAITIPGQGTWYGVSGSSHQCVAISKNMSFGIASNTKTFMAALILKLKEQNVIRLEDSVYRWIGRYPFIDSAITVKQLLNHTSGIYDVTEKPGYADSMLSNPNRIWTTPELLARFLAAPYFPKGQGFRYSNTNYLLLGMILKSVVNSDISIQLRQNILTPFQLNNTFFPIEEPITDTTAHPWANGVDISAAPRISLLSSAGSAGAMYSNSENMSRWYQMLFGGQVLSPQSLNEMLTFSAQSNNSYGLGVIRYIINGRTLFGHSGSIRGYTSSFLYDSTLKMSIHVMTNQYPGNAYLVSSALFTTVVGTITKTDHSGSASASGCELYQNYPNPFNSSAKIGYRLKQDAIVSLNVYDMQGRLVEQLVNGGQSAGYHETEVNFGSRLKSVANTMKAYASGIYIYCITVIDKNNNAILLKKSKKLILMK